MKPIGPEPGRVWPPAHCYMDDNGLWWEAPGVPLACPVGYVTVENCRFDGATTGIYVSSGDAAEIVFGGVRFESIGRS